MPDEQPKLTRQQLYQRIRETSKDAYILSEMKRLGFWPKGANQPGLAHQFIERRAQLLQKLQTLGREKRLYQDPHQALKLLHKARKKAALEKRESTCQQRNAERFQKAQRWHSTQQKLITYVGAKHSHGLVNVHSNAERLRQQNLQVLDDSQALASAMGITINELRFLVYQKEVSHINHYQRFEMVKKSGGMRSISAPMPRLKRAQYWVLDNILNKIPLHHAAHGFVPVRSIVSNALPHVGQDVVINLDLKDFFPTITYPRVKGVFKQLGYSEHLATVLGLLCTEPDTQEVELDRQAWFVASGERFLPQGAPTSPMISNILCRNLDKRLQGMANKLGFNYTRYADDLSFSASGTEAKAVTQLLWRCRHIVRDEGFVVHPNKTAIMRRHKKQEVTGVVVNDKPSVDRKTLKQFRALLHQIHKNGPIGKSWGKGELFASIEGYANFVAMVNADKGLPFQQKVAALKQQYGVQLKPGKLALLNHKLMRAKAAAGQAPRPQWWQAEPPAEPILERTAQETQIAKRAAQLEASKHTPTTESVSPNESRVSTETSPHTPSDAKGSGINMGIVMFVIAAAVLLLLTVISQ